MRYGLIVTMLIGFLFVLGSPARAAEPGVVLGLLTSEAEKYNVEFMQFGRMMPLYAENNIQASLADDGGTEEQLYRTFKQYHVISMTTSPEGVYKLDDTFRESAAMMGRVLARYVQEGGGLLVYPVPVRYPGSDDERYWNLVFAPLGLEILHEGVFDKTRAFQGKSLGSATFWFTRNIQAHPVTEGVAGLCLPLHGTGPWPGIVAMKYSPEWDVLVRGEKEAKSYRSGTNNEIDIEAEGGYPSAPPVLAVRSFGKGRVACYPLSYIFTGMNYGNPLWAHVVETRGDPDSGRPSDSMKMQMNACRWLGAPATAIPEFGTYRPAPYQPVTFPASADRSQPELGMTPEAIAASAGIRAVVGAHTAYTDGKGTVAQYVEAAKAAGLAVVVFADPLEKLTPEKLEKLKADCAEASKAGDFYACPGIEFTDGIGNRWAFWGEKVVFPDASFQDAGRDRRIYVQWDGEKVNHYGKYIEACGYVGSALLDYRQLRKNGAHPENLWWFFHYLPLVYDHGTLIADNYNDYLFGLRDLRNAAISSFTRITDPAEVAQAADLCYTGFNSLPNAKAALNTRCAQWGSPARTSGQFVSQGPVIVTWGSVGTGMDNWKHTRGAQRVRLYFAVCSEAGIAEVRVHDADRGPIRRFVGRGEKQLAREFELVHDQQRYLTLEVIDTAGKRAFSRYMLLYCYKSGLFRCDDNLNILGPTAMCWHPDRSQFFPAAKEFRNGSDFALVGWDTASATLGVPSPAAQLCDLSRFKESDHPAGEYPDMSKGLVGRLMDVGINNYDIQIATMRMTKLSEWYENEKRATPSMATVARDTVDLEYYERTHTMYAPMERVDMFVAWDYRRDKESRQNYLGAILWHEGEYRFKKDVTLQGSVPIPLIGERCPTDLAGNVGTTFVVTDADGSTRVAMVRDEKKAESLTGRIRPGGYAAYLATPVGYHGLLVPADMDFGYEARLPARDGFLAGLGQDGQVVKAGTVLKYRFGVATFADEKAGNALLEHTVKAMNLGGGHAGYPVEMKVGEIKDAVFFFTPRAKGSEAVFTLGPQSLIIDLPIRVQGLADNGCAAVYSTRRPWFRFIPVDADGTAWLTESIDQKNELWVGNILVADRKELRLTVVVDGQAEGAPPLIEVHNPTDTKIETVLTSPPNTPLFGRLATNVTVPAGDSLWLALRDGKLVPRE